MSRFLLSTARLLLAGLVVVAFGCTEQQEPVPDENAMNQARIRELQEMFDDADRARMAAEDRALQLQNELDKCRDQLAEAQAPPAEGWTSVPGGAMISIEGTVLFDPGKASLKSSAKSTLDQVAGAIHDNFAGYEIYVFGHTDTQPIRVSGWKDNYELSAQRALSVVRFLRSSGVSEHMAACGWGEYRPVMDNSTREGRQANRRVEIFAMMPQEDGAGTLPR